MPIYEEKIRNHNLQAHLDLENHIKTKDTGQITCTLRINGGNIVDLVFVEYVNVEKKYAPNKYTV
jgi:hypothetical protein